MAASFFGGTIEYLFRNNYDWDRATGYGLLVTLLYMLFVSIAMMFVPFICRIAKKEALPYKVGTRICLWNSIALFILSCVLMVVIDLDFIGGIGAIFFYFINKWIFVEPNLAPEKEATAQIPPCKKELIKSIQQTSDFNIDRMTPREAAE